MTTKKPSSIVQTDTGPMHPGDEAPEGTVGTGEDVCPTCHGTGKIDGKTCPDCDGDGYIIEGIGEWLTEAGS